MDPFSAVLSGISCLVLIIWVVAGNMLALALVFVRYEECLGKQAGEQEDGDDDLKELICEQEGGDDDLKEVICVT